MTGFHVRPDALDAQAARLAGIADDVAAGAAAEATGTGQAEFGVLIGALIRPGIRGLAHEYEQALTATAQTLHSAADGLRSTAGAYRDAESHSTHAVTSTGGTP